MKALKIGKNDAGQRLDKFLGKAVKGLPQSLMYKFIRTKKIKVNGKRTVQNYFLAEGDEIQLYIKDEFFGSPESDSSALTRIKPKLDIVYEDENIMLLNKRPGVLVHEDTDARDNTLIMHVKAYLINSGEYDPEAENSFAPALCNRIDRNTGGIVIAAKNAEALRVMNEKIRENKLQKYYLCLVHGKPPKKQDTMHAWLKKDSAANMVTVRDRRFEGAKEIITAYRTLEERGSASLLEVELITGRTHQIRAHMAHIGHPLLGDGKYGVNREEKHRGYKYQALYSYKLRFSETEGENLLSYLEGRTFSIPKEQIWFLSDKEGR